jgi:sec-independent protein translocase protein TatC
MSHEKSFKSFFEHLDEFRDRLVRSLIAFAVAVIVFYSFSDKVLHWIIKPVGQLYFTSPSEAFMAHMILATFGGLFISLPFILFEVWQFVALALKENEKRFIVYFFPLSIVLFLIGVLFAYFMVIPMIYKFFLGFSSDVLIPMVTVKNYISFVGNMTLSFGVVFQLPIVLVFLAKIGIATPEFLIQKRRHAIVILLIISAVVTPPDVISMIMMSVPLLILYELGIVALKWTMRHKKEGTNAVSI